MISKQGLSVKKNIRKYKIRIGNILSIIYYLQNTISESEFITKVGTYLLIHEITEKT